MVAPLHADSDWHLTVPSEQNQSYASRGDGDFASSHHSRSRRSSLSQKLFLSFAEVLFDHFFSETF